jgi:CheY-like chemotaxis protein
VNKEAAVEEKRKVLIVDDEPYILRVLKMKLELGGYAVDTAADGVEALEKIGRESPAVLITDINMPLMGGREICRFLKENPVKPPVFTIVVTSDADRANREWAERFSNTCFVEKPFSPRKILGLIDAHFAERNTVQLEVGGEDRAPIIGGGQ